MKIGQPSKSIKLSRPSLGEAEKQAVMEILDTDWLTHGPKTKEFEDSFAKYIGVRNAIATNSCASALFATIAAKEIHGEVIVPSFTFAASINAIVAAGAIPRFADIELETGNVTVDTLKEQLTQDTRAVMVVHYAGRSCEMKEIATFCEENGLLLIEDSAETIGGTDRGHLTGSWGVGCWSFFPTKNMTTGEGGMITTDDDQFARILRSFVAHGIPSVDADPEPKEQPWHRVARVPGFNFRMSNILAAIGVEQLKKLDEMNARRIVLAERLNSKLEQARDLFIPLSKQGSKHVYQMYVLQVLNGERNSLVEFLNTQGVEASVHFDPPVHEHPIYRKFVVGELPNTTMLSQRAVSLPMYPGLADEDVDYIANTVLTWCDQHA